MTSVPTATGYGYARVTRRPGICMAQHIGASNLAAGLRDAYLACSPVIAITGGPTRGERRRRARRQSVDRVKEE